MIITSSHWIGSKINGTMSEVKTVFEIIAETLKVIFTKKLRVKELFEQLYWIGNKSILILLFSITFAGMVVTLEYAYHMKLVLQTASMVPSFTTIMILRELGGAITALLLVAKVGAGMTAEIGTMKVTEQIDALRLLSINPVEYLTVPRFLASIIMTACLSVITMFTAIVGGIIVGVTSLNYSVPDYMQTVFALVRFNDFFMAIVKAMIFGAIIPIISSYYGFKCEKGAQGVGSATTNSVVTSSVLIIIFDFILSALFLG